MSGSNLSSNGVQTHANYISIFHGVRWSIIKAAWHAYIEYNNKEVSIGYYNDQAEAVIAYDDVAKYLMRNNPQLRYQLNFGQKGQMQTVTSCNGALEQQRQTPLRGAKATSDVSLASSSALPPLFVEVTRPESGQNLFFSPQPIPTPWATPDSGSISPLGKLTAQQLDEIEHASLNYHW